MFTQESISQELKRIQGTVPELLRKNVVRELPNKVWEAYNTELNDPSISEEKKKKIKIVLGIIKPTTLVENPQIAKVIDEHITREIKKAVKAGRLPTKKKLKELGFNQING